MSGTVVVELKPDLESAGEVDLARLEIAALLGIESGSIRHPSQEELKGRIQSTCGRSEIASAFLLAPFQAGTVGCLDRLAFASNYWANGSSGVPQQAVIELATCRATGRNVDDGKTRRREREYLGHGIHKYKAKFFPRFARALINICLPRDEGTVLDPFGGSGTAALEAGLLGLRPITNDIDPLSCLISRAKTRFPLWSRGAVDLVLETAHLFGAGATTDLFSKKKTSAQPRYSLPRFLRDKIEDEVVESIEDEATQLRCAFAKLPEGDARELASIVLSHVLSTKVSLRWMGTGDNRFALQIGKRSLASVAISHLKRLRRSHPDTIGFDLTNRSRLALNAAQFRQEAAHKLDIAGDSIDAIVTSPPYLPASSGRETYLRSRAPGITALNLLSEQQVHDLDSSHVMGSVLRRSSGVDSLIPESVSELVEWMRPQRARTAKADPTIAYFEELRAVGRNLHRILQPSGALAMVVATRHTFYELVSREVVRRFPFAEVLSDYYTDPRYGVGFSSVELVELELPKADYAARPASRYGYSETALIFRK